MSKCRVWAEWRGAGAPRGPLMAGTVLLAATGLLAAGCAGGAGTAAMHRSAAPALPAHVSITSGTVDFGSTTTASVVHGQRTSLDKRPDLGILVDVTGGRLTSVVATTVTGHPVKGALSGGGTWRTTGPLAPGRKYRVTATAVNAGGRKTVTDGTFTTVKAAQTFTAWTTTQTGQTYGVGMPIMITFSHPVTARAEVERSLAVWSSKPVVGAWYWMSSTEVWFRPKAFWPAHTDVRWEARLRGVRAAPGVFGAANVGGHFRIGNSLIAEASAATHYMRVWWNGHLKGRWPISTGQPGDDTPDGRYLSFTMGNPVDMNSASYGVTPGMPGYYNVEVYDSVKFTNSGDYVHSAPWSVAEQGVSNVSHGCVNVAPGNAAWYYNHSVLGDPIQVVGSPVKGTWGDGWTIWFLSWRKLVGGSGTGRAVEAGPHGTRFVSPQLPAPAITHLHAVTP